MKRRAAFPPDPALITDLDQEKKMPIEDDALSQIAGVREQTQTALTSDDVDGIMAALADDHVTMPPGEPAFTDGASLAAWHEARVAQFSLEGDFTTEEIRWYGDVAIERWSATNRLVPKGQGQEASDSLKGLWVWERQEDGSWKILWSIWNSNGGAEPM